MPKVLEFVPRKAVVEQEPPNDGGQVTITAPIIVTVSDATNKLYEFTFTSGDAEFSPADMFLATVDDGAKRLAVTALAQAIRVLAGFRT